MLILTTFDLDEYAHAALRAGASGFLLKDALPNDLLSGDPRSRQRRRRGGAQRDPAAARHLRPPAHRGRRRRARSRADLEPLTPREREVLLEVARGLSNAEIAAALYLTEATVKTHVGRILAKLRMRDRVQLVVFAYDIGLVRPAPR